MLYTLFILIWIAALTFLIAKQASIVVVTISFTIFAALFVQFHSTALPIQLALVLTILILAAFCFPTIRRPLFSRVLFNRIGRVMPKLSDTEREALNAGTVGWEGALFSGDPDFVMLHHFTNGHLTAEEQAFLEGPTHVLCGMIDDWDITHNRADLPEAMWKYIKDQGFLGMIIPKRYGGLEFSATAQMSILVKLYGRSISVATTVSVPNSLGPAELLIKYGTEDQKNYYLPRLAKGIDIPCFALTGPTAGSDAASIPDTGIVCQENIDGKTTLGIRLTWNKRYITLAPVATVIGLAFKLYDPDNLLGKGESLGITCALIPADTPGVVRGRRHFPLNSAFLNGPTQGKDVFVPIDCLIGGVAQTGQGWKMLMECLSAGRAISLPSSALGGAQAAALGSGAYAYVRKQFNQSIAKFEGIEEPLARIAGYTYIIDAAISMTTTEIDQGAKPAVGSGILKYHTTELARKIGLDAMDIHGGKGICMGPNNYLARNYQGTPIAITVEGANILTRSLIIFGQGAIRCHPYVLKEIESIQSHDLNQFDEALSGHIGFMLANFVKSFIFLFTDGYFTKTPYQNTKRYYQRIHRYSSQLAFLADFSMILLGNGLKRKEKLSARLGDLLSYLYLASAVLKRFHDDEGVEGDRLLMEWSCTYLFYQCEQAIEGIIRNFPMLGGRIFLKLLLQPLGILRKQPSDKLGQQLAQILTTPNETRQRLTRLAFAEPLETCPLGRLEQAFHKICQVELLEKKLSKATKAGQFKSKENLERIREALTLGLLNELEAEALTAAEMARQQVIAVDDFSPEDLKKVVAKKTVQSKKTKNENSIMQDE